MALKWSNIGKYMLFKITIYLVLNIYQVQRLIKYINSIKLLYNMANLNNLIKKIVAKNSIL